MGRYLYSIGNNEQATLLSGVNTFRVKLFAYGVSALLGGVAGILYAGYAHQGDPQIGVAYELDAVAAAVVGGASLSGGRGSVAGTVIGALAAVLDFHDHQPVAQQPVVARNGCRRGSDAGGSDFRLAAATQ